MKPKIKLIGGPWNGKEIEDRGAVTIKMCIYDPEERVGAMTGEAIYEPDENRENAFWLTNKWLGKIHGIIPA